MAPQSIMQVPGQVSLIIVSKVIGDSESRSLEIETEKICRAVEIRYLCKILLREDCNSTGITKLVLGMRIKGNWEKELIE